jgi:hypothetical protein
VDYQQGTFNLDLLESKVPKPLSQIDYKETQIKIKLGNIQPNDIIDLHQQKLDMLYKGVLQSSTSERKMREMVKIINRKLKKNNISTRENQTKIVDLENNIIALEIDPKYSRKRKVVLHEEGRGKFPHLI